MINTSVVIISAVWEMMVVETESDFMFEKKSTDFLSILFTYILLIYNND